MKWPKPLGSAKLVSDLSRSRLSDETTPTSGDGVFPALLVRLREGDEHAAAVVFERFVRRLVGLASQRLDARTRRLHEPEDVVQSAFRSFFARLEEGAYELDGWDSLWGLLTIITLRKCRGRRRYTHARKRDAAREVAWPESCDGCWFELVDREPSPVEAAMITELVSSLLNELKSPERAIVELCLDGYETREIASRLDRSERTVQRVRQAVRTHLEALIASDMAGETI